MGRMHLPQLWFIVVLTSHGGGRRIGPPRLHDRGSGAECRRHLKTDPVSERQNWISFRMPLTRSQTWLVNPGCRSRRTAIASRHSCSMEGADGPVLSTGNKLPISADGSRRRSWFIRHADRPDLLGHNCRPLSVVKEVGPCPPTVNIMVYCGTRAQLGLGGSLPMSRLVPSSMRP